MRDFKELAPTAMESGKYQICKVSHQAGDPGKSWRCSSSWRPSADRITSCSGLISLLYYSGIQLIGWDPCTLGRAICFFSKSVNVNVSLIHTYKHPIDHSVWFFTGLLNYNFRGFLLVLNQSLPSKAFNSVTFCHLGPMYYVTLKYNEHFVS